MTKTQAESSGLTPGCACGKPVHKLGAKCPECSKAHRARNHAAMDADKRPTPSAIAAGLAAEAHKEVPH